MIAWKEISEAEGTGLVHIAPGCGAEDQQLGKDNGIPFIAPLDDSSVFLDGFGQFTKRNANEVADDIIAALKTSGMLVAREKYPHVYPHCWRCTAALVSGAIADRAKFAAWMVFVPVWAIAVYAVVAHWVWAPGGWLFKLGVLDYAGGLVVEIVSGSSALALALVLGPRIGFKKDAMRPHNLPFVLLGVGLLWFGWFGFNAGSALAANGTAAAIFLNTLVAGCLGMLGWLSVEQIRDGRPTTFGAASGVVAGLVAITPSCGTVNTLGAAIVGLAAGIVCSFAIGLKFRFGYDDSLDVVGVHFVGGVVGVLLIGLLATEVMTGGPQGLFYAGGFGQLGKQALAAVVVGAYAFSVSFVLAKMIDRIMGFRVSAEDETTGVDFTQHAETAYAEGVHGHQPSRRPGSFGELGGDAATRDGRRRLAGSQ